MANNSGKDEFIVALDIGTTKVLCLVADYDDDGQLRIVGVGQENCQGLNKGVISEIDATVKSIRKAKDQARAMTNCKFSSVTTGIAGNHIQSYNGIENMIATQLRGDASSTRIYCKNCFSCVAVDHVNYQNNVFMIQPDYCKQNFNMQIPPLAVLNLQDYPGEFADLDSDTIPVFHSRKYPQERKRFLSIDPLSEFLAPPKTPAKGTTIREIISKIGKISVLGLIILVVI